MLFASPAIWVSSDYLSTQTEREAGILRAWSTRFVVGLLVPQAFDVVLPPVFSSSLNCIPHAAMLKGEQQTTHIKGERSTAVSARRQTGVKG